VRLVTLPQLELPENRPRLKSLLHGTMIIPDSLLPQPAPRLVTLRLDQARPRGNATAREPLACELAALARSFTTGRSTRAIPRRRRVVINRVSIH
jgi:hypothetical protein